MPLLCFLNPIIDPRRMLPCYSPQAAEPIARRGWNICATVLLSRSILYRLISASLNLNPRISNAKWWSEKRGVAIVIARWRVNVFSRNGQTCTWRYVNYHKNRRNIATRQINTLADTPCDFARRNGGLFSVTWKFCFFLIFFFILFFYSMGMIK